MPNKHKFIVSRYEQDADWLIEYAKPEEIFMYDRSVVPLEGAIQVRNIGTDLFDKFTYIIDNYDDLPDFAVYTKCNLFKYITKQEFDAVKDNRTFTPLLTKNHRCYDQGNTPVCFYKDGMYFEINNAWYLNSHPARTRFTPAEVSNLLGISDMMYVPFAPGSNYILAKEDILKNTKAFYEKLRGYLTWAVYPGEAQIIERGLFTIFSQW